MLVDERRFDEAPLNQVVLFSFVSMRGHQALKALHEMAELREKLEAGLYKGAFLRKQLLRGTPGVMGDLAEEWLKSAAITRVLASYEALRRWRDETNFKITSEPSGHVLKTPEMGFLLNALQWIHEMWTTATPLVTCIVDRSAQLGLDPNQLGLANSELGAHYHVMEKAAFLVVGSTPEDPMLGELLRLPDYDAALAAEDGDRLKYLASNGKDPGIQQWNVRLPGSSASGNVK